MKKSFLWIVMSLFFLSEVFAQENPKKPQIISPSYLVTPLTKKAQTIIIGQNGTAHAAKIGRELIELAKKDNVKADILVPTYLAGAIMEEFKKYLKDPMVSFVNVPADDLLWPQDIFQFMQKEGKIYVVDLPYNNREGEHVPQAYALSKKLDYQETFLEPEVLTFSNGDFGGNIEAIDENYIYVGSNLSDKLMKWLKTNVKQKILVFDVDWLETGHVDEIISFIPAKQEKGCPGIFLYASPTLGHRSLIEHKQNRVLSTHVSEMDEIQTQALTLVKRCYDYPELFNKDNTCKKYLSDLEKFDNKILTSVAQVKKVYPECKSERFISLPLIFYTIKNEQEKEMAFSLNANPVNGIYLNSFYIAPKQSFAPFNKLISEKLSKWIDIEFLESDFINALQGGIHCMTNIMRD